MLIGMAEAAKRLGLSGPTAVRRLLKAHGIEPDRIHDRAFVIEDSVVEDLKLKRRPRGRPKKDEGTSEGTNDENDV